MVMPIVYNAKDSIQVDGWDCKVIALAKGHIDPKSDFVEEAKKVWAERCSLEAKYVQTEYIVQHFLPMIAKLNPENVMTVVALGDPKSMRWTVRREMGYEPPSYWDMLLINIGSIFACTEVKFLIGYQRH